MLLLIVESDEYAVRVMNMQWVTLCHMQGKYYMLVEILSQSYRCVLPITPWIYFLLDDEDSSGGRVSFASILLLAYVGFKVCAQRRPLSLTTKHYFCL